MSKVVFKMGKEGYTNFRDGVLKSSWMKECVREYADKTWNKGDKVNVFLATTRAMAYNHTLAKGNNNDRRETADTTQE